VMCAQPNRRERLRDRELASLDCPRDHPLRLHSRSASMGISVLMGFVL
jgi:hypothetical protein